MTGLRVVLAEDDVLLREGMAGLLDRSGLAVVGQAGDAARLASGRGIGYLPGPHRRPGW